jgi:formylglycine-generating enzyme required for sulfatase activity
VADDLDKSIGDEATLARQAKRRQTSELSLGDQRTLGDNPSGQDTVIDDIEIIDLDARYKVEGTLGQGGMGAVLLATDTRLDRKVAIKRILGEAAGNRMAVQRFLTEAKSIAALNHPNIVQIYDYGQAKDGPFLIMEYVDGGSLLDRCRESPLPLEEAIDIACQLCDGLAKAHDLGIVHRDIKPANVLLSQDGIPKLTDFGLAKAQASDAGQTMTGAVLGTPDFMPPEQRRDASLVDHRSDLWSLAATVYQIVTGRSPKVIRLHELPQALQAVIAKALEDAKDARYQSARELRDALKMGFRSVAPVTGVSAVGEGQCISCGERNDASRKFCRGCGESLFAPCLKCSEHMPLWEEVCGSCGGKQSALVRERKVAFAVRQTEAEGDLGDFKFDHASKAAAALQAEAHPRLREISDWVDNFLHQIEQSLGQQTARALEAIAESAKHEAAHDYLSAAVALESVPEALRRSQLPGAGEAGEIALTRVKQKRLECLRLESSLKEQIAAKSLDGLLPVVEKLLVLKPERQDVRNIRVQLLERQEKQAAARDEAVRSAQRFMAAHEYEAAVLALQGAAAATVTPEVVNLRQQAEALVEKVRTLSQQIKEAVAAKRLDGLLVFVEKYLVLKPSDPQATGLRQTLVERERRFETEIAARLEQAKQLAQECRFSEADALLDAIPMSRRTATAKAFSNRVSRLAPLRQVAMKALSKASPGGYLRAIEASKTYAAEIANSRIADGEFAALLSKAETALADEARLQHLFIAARMTAAVILAFLAVAAVGLWVRSWYRSSSLSTAIAQSRWNDALAIAPSNPQALVGRARQRLQAKPADIDGAFADLEKANRQPGALEIVEPARAEAHAVRAAFEARAGRLDHAGQELQAAIRGGANQVVLFPAQSAIAKAWLARAKQAAAKGDGVAVRNAVNAALAAGASAAVVAPLRAKALVSEALAAQKKGDSKSAASTMAEASLLDAVLVRATLMNPAYAALRTAVIADYGSKFDAAVARKDWERALQVRAAAATVDKSAGEWVAAAVAALPPTALASLPPNAVLKLPPIQNSVGMELKLLPVGTFTMGEATGDSDETPHQVSLTRTFYIGVHEVTNAQWKRVMGSVPSNWKDDDRPVEMVSWDDAMEFCKKLSELPEERKAGRVYRLPTEAEWEYACRAGTTTTYSFGDDESKLGDHAWFDEHGGAQTHPVGYQKPNAWGLYDMHGNVSEWCGDWYGHYGSGPATDPQGPSGASSRIDRGGDWHNAARFCRSANRSWQDPSDRYITLGFRLALSPSESQPVPPEAGSRE